MTTALVTSASLNKQMKQPTTRATMRPLEDGKVWLKRRASQRLKKRLQPRSLLMMASGISVISKTQLLTIKIKPQKTKSSLTTIHLRMPSVISVILTKETRLISLNKSPTETQWSRRSLTLGLSSQRPPQTQKPMGLASLLMSRPTKEMILALVTSLAKNWRRKEKQKRTRTVMASATLGISNKLTTMMMTQLLSPLK